MNFRLAPLLVVLSIAQGARADLQEVKQRGELRWGGDLQGGEPYVFEDPEEPGKVRGFEVEIAEGLAARLGVRAKFQQTDWSALVPTLLRGDFDLILNGLEDTPERRDRLLLSVPYFVYGETLTVRKGAPYRALGDLAGLRVGTLNQTKAHEILLGQPLEVVLYEGQQEPYFDLVNQRTDAVLLDHVIADRYGCPLPALECVPTDVARGTYVIGLRQSDTELKRAVDAALTGMIQSGELRGILTRWKLWDARQELLGSAPPSTSPSPPTQSAPEARRFGLSQLALFVKGALVTLLLSVSAFLIAGPLGILLALARLYTGRVGRTLSLIYTELFRGTPLLLQLYVLYFGLAELIRLPPLTAAILGLGLNYAAYEAEVYRGALSAIARGQAEAAQVLGLGRWQTIRHVLLPQALRSALPAVTNDFVALLKDSSLVSVITVVELTKRMTIVAADLRDWFTPGLACAALYLALSFPLARLSRALEQRLHHAPHLRLE